MKRWLLWGAALWMIWMAGVLYVNPSWPLARRYYVWFWRQAKAYDLDPCRSCQIPDRFK